MKEKVVLAFSGGLDTSYCVKYLAIEKKLEVHTVIVNTGGFSETELIEIEQKALRLGAASHQTLDETARYYQQCIRFMIFGNVLRNQTYPLSVSSERVFQAKAVAEYALKMGARYIAHGSTGAGNDQVRFDLAFQILCPDVTILTPIRDQKLSREEEIAYLKKNGVEGDWKKAVYSINKGIWGTSIGGKETLTSDQPLPEEAYPGSLQEKDPIEVTLEFEKGELRCVNNILFDNPVEAIQYLNELGSKYAIGRDIHIGDTIIGIKGRVGFEAPAALMLIKAHHTLEKHTLSKWQMHWKEQLGNWYGMFLHEAMYFEPVMRNIERFLEDTQQFVTGKVFLRLCPYRFEILGVQSAYDLMQSKFGQYGEMNKAWTGEDVKGFIKVLSNPLQIYYSVHSE